MNEPGVTVTMSDGEELRLVPTNPMEKPHKNKSLRRLTKLLEDSNDAAYWSNLKPLMEGFQMSREPFLGSWLEQIVRKAHEKHMTGVVIQCARQVKDTGFSLSNSPVTRELFLGLHQMAVEAEFKGPQLKQASQWAEQIVLMMEDELHCGGKLNAKQTDMRRDILVMATYLELNAATALESGQDANDKAHALVTRLLALWRTAPPQPMHRIEREMERDIIILHAMQLASKVQSVATADIATDLRLKMREMEKNVMDIKKKVSAAANGKLRRCLNMYEAIYGK